MVLSFPILDKGYFALCIVMAVGTTIYCINNFSKNGDSSSIAFKKYHDNDVSNIYPALTLCLTDYLDAKKFGNNTNLMKKYYDFLNNEIGWSEELRNIYYQDVTLNISEFIVGNSISEFKEKDEQNRPDYGDVDANAGGNPNDETDEIGPAIVSQTEGTDGYFKCWTFTIPHMHNTSVMKLAIRLKKSVFKNSERPTKGQFRVSISYPGQALKANVMNQNWAKIGYDEFSMEYDIQNVVVLKRRQTFQKKCLANFTDDDRRQIKLFIPILGCYPPFVTPVESYPQCQDQIRNITKEDMMGYEKLLNEEYYEPCRQIEKVLYSYNEYPRHFSEDSRNGTVFELMLRFQGTTFMEIEQFQAYDLLNLFGNIGGYIGAILGLCLLQLPNLVLDVYNSLTGKFHFASTTSNTQ